MTSILGGEGLASGAAVEAMLKAHPVRLSMLDEMGHVMQQITSTKAGSYEKDIGKKMLQFYTAASSVYKGTDYADTKVRPTVVIHNPIWCVYGTTTVATLRSALQNNMAEDGTLPRMMFFKADRVAQDFDADPSTPPPGDLVDFVSAVNSTIDRVIGNLASTPISEGQPPSIEVEWTEETYEIYKAMCIWADSVRSQRSDLWTRLMENTIKIAMIDTLTTADLHRPVMKPESLQKGLDLAVWCMHNLEDMVRDEGAENATEATYKKVLKIIRENDKGDGMSGTQFAQKTRFLNNKERSDALASMSESGDIILVQNKEKKAGRPAYRVFARR